MLAGKPATPDSSGIKAAPYTLVLKHLFRVPCLGRELGLMMENHMMDLGNSGFHGNVSLSQPQQALPEIVNRGMRELWAPAWTEGVLPGPEVQQGGSGTLAEVLPATQHLAGVWGQEFQTVGGEWPRQSPHLPSHVS